jgi:hypothetical protein
MRFKVPIRAKLWAAAWVSAVVLGCANTHQQSQDQELAQRYPPGADRTTLLEQGRSPQQSTMLATASTDDRVMRNFAHLVEQETGVKPHRCDTFTVLRTTLGSSMGAAGLYFDYVFYDQSDRILKSYRRFIDYVFT